MPTQLSFAEPLQHATDAQGLAPAAPNSPRPTTAATLSGHAVPHFAGTTQIALALFRSTCLTPKTALDDTDHRTAAATRAATRPAAPPAPR